VHLVVRPEARALGLISVIAGSLSVFALVALFERLDSANASPDHLRQGYGGPPKLYAKAEGSPGIALTAALVAGTAPLYWFSAARPLSDMAGLAAALGVQALILRASTRREWIVAAFLAGFAAGLRSQVLWLTVPLLVWCVARRFSAGIVLALAGGILAWAIPLI